MTVIRALRINLVFETNNHVILSEAKDLELRILNYYIRESSRGARVLRTATRQVLCSGRLQPAEWRQPAG